LYSFIFIRIKFYAQHLITRLYCAYFVGFKGWFWYKDDTNLLISVVGIVVVDTMYYL